MEIISVLKEEENKKKCSRSGSIKQERKRDELKVLGSTLR
jgi:hypothetical protein